MTANRVFGAAFRPLLAAAMIAISAMSSFGQRPVAGPVTPEGWYVMKRAQWERATERLIEASDEADEAIAEEMARLDGLFVEAKRGAGRFADDMLSAEAKLKAGYGALEKGAESIARGLEWLMGGKASPPMRELFRDYAGERFRERILESGALGLAMKDRVGGFSRRLKAIESRYLVALRIDADDRVMRGFPPLSAAYREDQIERGIRGAMDVASGDVGVAIGEFVLSDVVGNLVAGAAAGKNDSNAKKLAKGIAADVAAGELVDRAIRGTGYDPASKIAAGVRATIDRLRGAIVEGNGELAEVWLEVYRTADSHPDEEVRRAWDAVARLIEAHPAFGLRLRLQAAKTRRIVQFHYLAFRVIFGPGVEVEPYFATLPSENRDSKRDMLEFARTLTKRYGG